MSARDALAAALHGDDEAGDVMRRLAADGVYLVTAETLAEGLLDIDGDHIRSISNARQWAAAILAALSDTPKDGA